MPLSTNHSPALFVSERLSREMVEVNLDDSNQHDSLKSRLTKALKLFGWYRVLLKPSRERGM